MGRYRVPKFVQTKKRHQCYLKLKSSLKIENFDQSDFVQYVTYYMSYRTGVFLVWTNFGTR